jgi:arginyl-tRNA synthetase
LIDFQAEIAGVVAGLPAIEEAGLSAADVLDLIEVPADSAKGDYAFPCFRLAKALRKAPPAIAADLVQQLGQKAPVGVSRIQAEGPYLNFFLDRALVARDVVGAVLEAGAAYGSATVAERRPVIVEFSSPNIAKPFHIGHIRSTVIGNSIEKIYRFLGYDTIRINHLGDYGTQFGKMIVAYRKWGSEEAVNAAPIESLISYYKKFHEEADSDPALEDEAREVFAALERGSEEELKLWQWFREESLKEFGRVYDMLGITFDSYNGESFYSDKMERVTDELAEKGLLEESDGAQIVRLDAYNMPPAMIRKSDGSTLYITRDIAAAIYRKETYDFAKNIYVVASQQNLHFSQWFTVLRLMGYEWAADCVHIPFGLVSLEDGVMKSRLGNVVFLEDVLTRAVERTKEIIIEKNVNTDDIEETARQVGIGAVIFNELANNRIKDYVFRWEKVLNFDGETGPYVQYSHARAASVLRKAGAEADTVAADGVNGECLSSDRAYPLVKLLGSFPAAIKEAGEKYEPSILTRHIIDVAQAFNRFYHDEQILVEDAAERRARIALVAAARQVIATGLGLLGVEAPDRM